MKRRHIEWLNIYNSNCDADENIRKSKRQLLKELDEWEQTQGGRADSKESKIMRKDFDGSGYAKANKTDFDDLIARARQKRGTPKVQDGPQENGAGKAGQRENGTGQQDEESRDGTGTQPQPSTDHGLNEFLPEGGDLHLLDPQRPQEGSGPALAIIQSKIQEANHTAVPFMRHYDEAPTNAQNVPSENNGTVASDSGLQNSFTGPTENVSKFVPPKEPARDVENYMV